MKHLKYFSKRALFPLFYSVFMMSINLPITLLGDDQAWIKYLLFSASFIFSAVVIAFLAFKEGVESVKTMHANDVERLNIIRTGEDRPLNLAREYKPWKGFVIGATICIPLVILLLAQLICYMVNPVDPAILPGAIASCLYIVVFSFFRPSATAYEGAQTLLYFWNLISIPVYMLMYGIPYLIGAKKQNRIYSIIEEKRNLLHGEDN